MSAEPTAEQLSVAMQLITANSTHGGDARIDFADAIARALATAVTAEREKYLRVADEIEQRMKGSGPLVSGEWAARRIREVTT